MTFRALPQTVAICAALTLASPLSAAGFNGEVSISPQLIAPVSEIFEQAGPVLPAALVAVLFALAVQGGTGTGSNLGEGNPK